MEKRISELPTGEKIVDTIMFRGLLFAATHDGVFYLDGQEWKRLELAPPDKPLMYEYKPGGITWIA